MPRRDSSKHPVQFEVKAPRALTANEAEELQIFLERQAKDWMDAEVGGGCWCTGFDHSFTCRHNPLNKRSTG